MNLFKIERRSRWSDNDYNFGPFTYARDSRGYRPLALVIHSGDDDDRHCHIRLSGFGHTFIMLLPSFILRPWRRKVDAHWDEATVKRLGRNWYYDTHPRMYGLSCNDGFLQVFFGRQTHDSSTTQQWSKHLPWMEWRHVRRSLYDTKGHHFWTKPQNLTFGAADWELRQERETACPSVSFWFKDFDGEELTARTRIEEREWRFGTGWFKWLSHFRKPKISRYLDITFSGETGKRKGSWKGGTIGHSIDLTTGEDHVDGFKRYCAEHNMTYVGPREAD